jgi:acetylornithine deacetylase/succinyl-diaminopimelate desuccinylase-like protein
MFKPATSLSQTIRFAFDWCFASEVEFLAALVRKPSDNPRSVFCRHLQCAAKVTLQADIPTEGAPLYTDARLYCEAGVPTVIYGAGPRTLPEANGHRADKRVALEDLRIATKTVALALSDLLSGT